MASQRGNGNLRAVGLLLMTLLALLDAGQLPTLDSDLSGEEPESVHKDRRWDHSLADGLSNEAESDSESEAPQLQVEATKRLWIAELAEKADHPEEAVDLIDEIQSRTSSSGLRSLKAACKAMCAKCICGVILLPSLPRVEASKGSKKRKAPLPSPPPATPKKPAEPTTRPKVPAVTTKAPVKTAATTKPVTTKMPPVVPPKSTVAHVSGTSPSMKGLNSAKKAKKWLSDHLISLESQLPDFLLDEAGNDNVYKREVDDHDPLSASHSSDIGIE